MGDLCNYIETLILLNLCRPSVVSTQNYTFNFDNRSSDSNYYPVPRIVNGERAVLGQFPYQIALKQNIGSRIYMTFCGGALLGPTKILSAAHCLVEKGTWCQRNCQGKEKVVVLRHKYAVAATLLNKSDRRYKDPVEQWRKMTTAFIPEGYKFPVDDIALMFTDKPFYMNNNVGTLPMAQKTIDYGEIGCTASGYGRLSQYAKSPYLMWAELQLINMKKCSYLHPINMEKFICTSSVHTSILQGDSGGPLVCFNTKDANDAGHGVVVGVVSGMRIPGGTFFTRVSSYYRLLEENNASIPTINVACLCIILSYYIKNFL